MALLSAKKSTATTQLEYLIPLVQGTIFVLRPSINISSVLKNKNINYPINLKKFKGKHNATAALVAGLIA